MAIKIVIDGRTIKETANVSLNILNAIDPAHRVELHDVDGFMAEAPHRIECDGYKYTQHDDGTTEVIITDDAIRRVNGFVSVWAPAIAGLVVSLKAQVKVVKRFVKRLIKADAALKESMTNNLKIDGLSPDAWADKKAKEAEGITEDLGPLV